jgi:hypothetical protein
MSVQQRRDADADLETRDVKALSEHMVVLDELAPAPADAPGLFHVTAESGRSYVVDAREESCTCADHRYRETRCKHLRRVAFETGARDLPAWVDRDRLDRGFRQFVTPSSDDVDRGEGPMTDGGVGSFEDLTYGDELRYVGPDDVGDGWASPRDYDGPFTFQHVTVGGTLSLLTRFKGRKRYAPEHPCNNRAYWEVVDEADDVDRGDGAATDGGTDTVDRQFHLELELPDEYAGHLLVDELPAVDARAVAQLVTERVEDRADDHETLRDRLEDLGADHVIRRPGRDCDFYYRLEDGRAVERAVFDGGVGGVYDAQTVLENYAADAGEVLPADAWPTSDVLADTVAGEDGGGR